MSSRTHVVEKTLFCYHSNEVIADSEFYRRKSCHGKRLRLFQLPGCEARLLGSGVAKNPSSTWHTRLQVGVSERALPPFRSVSNNGSTSTWNNVRKIAHVICSFVILRSNADCEFNHSFGLRAIRHSKALAIAQGGATQDHDCSDVRIQPNGEGSEICAADVRIAD